MIKRGGHSHCLSATSGGQHRSWTGLAAAVTAASLLLAPLAPLQAASLPVHRAFARRSVAGTKMGGLLGIPDPPQAVRFWLGLAEMFGAPDPLGSGDDPDALAFRARYASPYEFRAERIREFLGLSSEPTPTILALDRYDNDKIAEGAELIAMASAMPDIDQRNQHRYARDAAGNRLKLPDGRYVPVDPMLLNMGSLGDLSAQAHAHYQLAADHPSDSAEVLQKEPWNFVVAAGWPGPVETSAADMAQIHLDIAVLARSWSRENPGTMAEYLQLSWLGAGLHYIQDAAGPLHNVQVGSYELFKLAKLTYWKLALQTLGGYAGRLPSFVEIGMGFLHNHHLFAEQWLVEQVELLEAGKPAALEIQQAWDVWAKDDPELIALVKPKLLPYFKGFGVEQQWQDGTGGATILVHALAELGKRDGQAMYDAAMKASSGRLREVGFRLGDDEPLKPEYKGNPDDPEVQAADRELARLHAKSMRRTATASRIYLEMLRGDPRSSLLRLRRHCLLRLDTEEKRRAAFIAKPPPVATGEVRDPLFLVGPLGAGLAALGLVAWMMRRRRRTR